MERRGFLSLLGLGAAGLAVQAVPKFMVFDPKKLQVVTGVLPVRLVHILKETAREFRGALGSHRLKYSPHADGAAKVGEMVGGATLTDQVYLTTKLPLEEEMEWRTRYAKPVGETLAAEVKHRGIHTLSDLALPLAGADGAMLTDEENGIALRAVVLYDIKRDEYQMRYDLIGAA